MLDSRVIFNLKFSVSLFGTQNRDFLLEKGTKYTNKITKQIIVSWFWSLSQCPHFCSQQTQAGIQVFTSQSVPCVAIGQSALLA